MATVRLESEKIIDWATFHSTCKEVMGFPDFYGNNMNAWIDCLTYLDEGDGMSKFELAENEILQIEITNTEQFKSNNSEIFDALIKCSAFVNRRYVDGNSTPKLALIFL